jgi:hypothetical protein
MCTGADAARSYLTAVKIRRTVFYNYFYCYSMSFRGRSFQ